MSDENYRRALDAHSRGHLFGVHDRAPEGFVCTAEVSEDGGHGEAVVKAPGVSRDQALELLKLGAMWTGAENADPRR
jgi:hypothetical protein